MVHGKCGRGGQHALVLRQYFDDTTELTTHLVNAIIFHRLLAEFTKPRAVPVLQLHRPVIRVYSDASFEPGSNKPARIGFVVLPHTGTPVGMTAVIPDHVIAAFDVRDQQITPLVFFVPSLYLSMFPRCLEAPTLFGISITRLHVLV